MNKTDLTDLIAWSFKDIQPPGDSVEDIFHEEVFETSRFMDIIRGKDWREFLYILETHDETCEISLPLCCADMIYYLTPKAFHYFAPAYLIHAINSDSTDIITIFFSRLLPVSYLPVLDPDQLRQRLEQFSNQQMRTLGLAINYFAHIIYSHEERARLRKYWMKWIG